MVDDPYTFGKIAAANALSDVYAMGGRPVMALNLACFPMDTPASALADILRGGADKLKEAGCALAGGHSIYDDGIKYGLAVTGLTTEDKLLRNNTPVAGHRLILTKALGVGIIMAANRENDASDVSVKAAVASMERLNRYAAEKMDGYGISACTDITGFGLICHAMEMAGEGRTIMFDANALPILPGVLDLVEEGWTTGGGARNRKYAEHCADISVLPPALQEVCFDPQTSGGLLIAVEASQADKLLALIQKDDPAAALVGRVTERGACAVYFE